MKKLIVLFCLLAASVIKAQAPQYLNYQGIARDAGGTIITTAIGVKFEILQGSASGTVVYDETNTITPSSAGIFTTAIGSGVSGIGTFSLITWANGPYYIRVSIDPTGGTSYSTVGTSQLLSVPYALYAEKAGNTQTVNISGSAVTGTYPNYTITAPGAPTASTGISISGGTITNTAPDQTVTLTAAGISSVSGTYPSYTIDVPPPALNYNTGTNVLTLTQGTAVATTTLVGAGSNTVAMFASGIASVSPVGAGSNFTVSVQSPSFTSVGATSVTGTYPNFVINSPGASTTVPTSLQVNLPHTTSTLSPNNFSLTIAPTNITGAGVTGSYPNYTVTAPAATSLTGVGVATVSGTSPNFTVGVPGPSLSVSGNSITITQGTVSVTKTITASPWNYASGTISPANNSTNDKVVIGQTIGGGSLLDVTNTAASTLSTSPVVYINNANTAFSTTGVLEVKNSAGGGAGIFVSQNNNLGDGIAVNTNGTTNGGNAVQVNHYGNGNAGFFSVNKVTSNGKAIDATTSGTGISISGVISNSVNSSPSIFGTTNGTGPAGSFVKNGTGYGLSTSHNGTAGYAGYFSISNASNSSQVIYGETGGSGDVVGAYNLGSGRAIYASSNNTNQTILSQNSGNGYAFEASNLVLGANHAGYFYGGLDIRGKTSNSSDFGLVILNTSSTNLFNVRNDGNVGVGNPTPNNRLSVYDATTNSAALFSQQNSATSSSSAHGVMGLTSNSNTFAAGVHGESSGAGPAVSGSKLSGSGSAGRFEITSTTNTADGLFATTFGGGAAIHAVNGPTVAGSSNAALWLEAGHLKSTQATAPTTTTISISGGGVQGVSVSLTAGSTDVKGVMNAVLTTTGQINSGNFATIRVNFNKGYAVPPVVVVTSLTDLGLTHLFVTNVTTTSFNLTVKNSTSGTMGAAASFPMSFNYMVIE